MDVDFHYYATYAAAKFAGWNTSDAETIAYSAQFVDEFDWSYGSSSEPWSFSTYMLPSAKMGAFRFDKLDLTTGASSIRPRRTVQSPGEVATALHIRKDIWIPFHFLPGNYDIKGSERYEEYFNREGCSDKNFNLLCRPFSPLALAMINELLAFNRDHTGYDYLYLLQLVGVRMHVFADTWAHQDFVGDGIKAINDCLGYYNFLEQRKDCLEQLNCDVTSWSSVNLGYSPNVQLPRSYLGHGKLGRFPDYSWAKIYYSPAWLQGGNTTMLLHNNPENYQVAFFELVKVLYALKNKKPKYPNEITLHSILGDKLTEISIAVKKAITLDTSDILYSKTDVVHKTTEQWKNLIKEHCGGGDVNFIKEKWKEEAKSALINPNRKKNDPFKWNLDKFKDTNLYKFNLAAEHHFAFVKTRLREDLRYELDDINISSKEKAKVGSSANLTWQPDDSVSKCPICTRSFTFLFRKHHCRNCGRVVCGNCAPENGLRHERVCEDCKRGVFPKV